MKPKMTVGLAFAADHLRVLMQMKNRPEHCKGRLNGPGGKHEADRETLRGCMVREFAEETGIQSTQEDWLQFHHERHLSGTDLYFYTTDKLDIDTARTKTDEPLLIAHLNRQNGFIVPEHFVLHVEGDYIREKFSTELEEFSRLVRYGDRHRGRMYNMAYLIPMALTYLEHPEHRYLEG